MFRIWHTTESRDYKILVPKYDHLLTQKNDWSPTFHTFTEIDGKNCRVIVARIININVVSPTIVKRFWLIIVDHPHSYKVSWIDNTTHEVTHRCLVPIDFFNIYVANIWCNVIAINMGHILLGMPWLYNNNVLFDDWLNLHRFEHEGKNKLLLCHPKPKPIEQKSSASNESSEVSMTSAKGFTQEVGKFFCYPKPHYQKRTWWNSKRATSCIFYSFM